MSELLQLGRDHIERMSNPIYGVVTNEEYSMRFARLLSSEGFEARLRREIVELRDPGTLTSYGWLWLLGWAKARQVDLVEDLLLELYREWSNVFVKAEIIDLATQKIDEAPVGNMPADLEEFPNTFLRQVLTSAVEAPSDSKEEQLGGAEGTFTALLQVDRPITTEAAHVLMSHRWAGHDRLVDHFWSIADHMDEETREMWVKRLHLPRRRHWEGRNDIDE